MLEPLTEKQTDLFVKNLERRVKLISTNFAIIHPDEVSSGTQDAISDDDSSDIDEDAKSEVERVRDYEMHSVEKVKNDEKKFMSDSNDQNH